MKIFLMKQIALGHCAATPTVGLSSVAASFATVKSLSDFTARMGNASPYTFACTADARHELTTQRELRSMGQVWVKAGKAATDRRDHVIAKRTTVTDVPRHSAFLRERSP